MTQFEKEMLCRQQMNNNIIKNFQGIFALMRGLSRPNKTRSESLVFYIKQILEKMKIKSDYSKITLKMKSLKFLTVST